MWKKGREVLLLSKLNKKVKITIFLVIVGLAIWFNRSYLQFDTNQIRNWIVTFGFLAPLIYILLYTIRPLIFFPASVLSIAGGLAFGALLGTIYTIIGATLGAMISFIVARKLGEKIGNKEWKGNAKRIQAQMEVNGFFYVLLFRFIPLVNFDLISYLAGISKVRLTSFFLGTIIGIIPGTFAYNFLGSSMISGNPMFVITAVIVFVVLTIVPIFVRKRITKKSDISING
jgi:uncharacterized membrane protein YdjX (TVP38/TMEM64 family)